MCLNLCKNTRDFIPAPSATLLQISNVSLSFNCFPIGNQNGYEPDTLFLNIFISYLSLFIKENVSVLEINSFLALPTNSALLKDIMRENER